MSPTAGTSHRGLPWIVLAAGVGLLAVWSSWSRSGPALVVYCAHDAVYSGAILAEFERRTGVQLQVRHDTEATKSLGLVELIARERERPRCDVFWNNEVLGTMRLADEGLLEPYRGPGFARIPPAYRDSGGRWAGFAARARVWIVNTERMPATVTAIDAHLRDGLAAGDLGDLAVARPLYGTTRTHYTLRWHLQGGDRLQAWHRGWRAAGVREVTGNSTVKNLVAAGSCALGLTDTDDYFLAVDDGAPVGIVPVTIDGAAVRIPNTVAIVAGTDRREAAQQLVDFLLSAETEIALANCASRQIPLGEVDEQALPDEVRTLRAALEPAHDLAAIGDARRACLAWLRSEYLR